MKYESTFSNKLIYIFRINDPDHEGALKIGETEAPDGAFFAPNSKELNDAAKKRINQYTQTAGIRYELLHTEMTVYSQGGKIKAFNDKQVHDLLLRSGIQRKDFKIDGKSNEWFICDLETARKAIAAVKAGQSYLAAGQISTTKSPIKFRPEQLKAIDQTKRVFFKGNNMLWNAKMRMGKTLTSLQVIKEMEFRKSIIVTHRPVVDDGWFEDFGKIFYESNNKYRYGSRNRGAGNIATLERQNCPYVYFASIQDLRGSSLVGGNFDKNDEIFSTEWDLVIIDEAHEGTQTALGQAVLDELIKPDTKVLNLSGTPFNLMKDFDEETTFTWDYMMEQQAKADWYKNHPGDPNPYEDLPKLNILTFDLAKVVGEYKDEDLAFNFREFFRTWTGERQHDHRDMPASAQVGDFVHKDAVSNFLNIISRPDKDSSYPFATEQYREFFRHTLWMVPGVKEGKALTDMMRAHPVFGAYTIVNVAGDEDEESIYNNDALQEVKTAMTDHPEDTYTITISCGKLTTGVTIKPWTAVLMLSGSKNTSPANYMQTIFRVQSPAVIGGRQKTQCYVFDFAPDRTLKMIAEAVKISAKAGATTSEDRVVLGEFLNFCPIISVDGTNMSEYNVDQMMQQLKRAYVDRVVNNGFEDGHLYNDNLMRLTDVQAEQFADLQAIIGQTKAQKKSDKVEINNQGFDQEQIEKERRKDPKGTKTLTDEQIREKLDHDRRRKQRNAAISILRGISIRMPMLIYGADLENEEEALTLDRFIELVDDQSWEEFMPKGVTKDLFAQFKQYYDEDIFAAAGKQIRELARAADDLPIIERIRRITDIFKSFRNPDKETVLTPWPVVNMHMSDCLGGYSFYDDEFKDELPEPRLIDRGTVTQRLFENANVRILEINSKSGLYPLYVAYSVFVHRCRVARDAKSGLFKTLTLEEEREIWKQVLRENLFVICKTEMARKITRRTLTGFSGAKINSHVYDDLINQLANKQAEFISKINSGRIFKQINNMKFDAIVGNPPYQGLNHQQIYPYFYLVSKKLGKYVSLIFPIGWQEPKNGNNLRLLNNEEVKYDSQIHFIDNRQNVFAGVPGAEWVNLMLWEKGYNNNLSGKQRILTNGKDEKIVELVINKDDIEKPQEIVTLSNIVMEHKNFVSLQTKTSARKPYGLTTDVFNEPDKYGLEPFNIDKQSPDDIKIYGNKGEIRYVNKNYAVPKKTKAFNKYKVFVPYAWGNWSESSGLGGAFANIIIGCPNEICTEYCLESGCFDTFEEAQKHAKFLNTRFARALLYMNKHSQHSTTAWGAVPVLSYTEDWWDKPIFELEKELVNLYSIPENIAKFILQNFQIKDETNIINFR